MAIKQPSPVQLERIYYSHAQEIASMLMENPGDVLAMDDVLARGWEALQDAVEHAKLSDKFWCCEWSSVRFADGNFSAEVKAFAEGWTDLADLPRDEGGVPILPEPEDEDDIPDAVYSFRIPDDLVWKAISANEDTARQWLDESADEGADSGE